MAPCLQLGVLGPIPVGGDQLLEPPAGVLAGLAKCKRSVVYLPTLKGDVFVRESYHSANKRDHRI